ncbi:hypothetical protein ACQEU8_32540 [Streptomyces sp. CA-250714]|uniref:hypothetical protein n=1 Tax=Streptomyces sp. CA-250714 TaxID=3240060 RepID=UPI003D8E0CD5
MPDKRILAYCAALLMVIAGSVGWWLQRDEKDDVLMPRKVCNDVFSGGEVEPLFASMDGEFDSSVKKSFPGSPESAYRSPGSTSCEMSIDGHGVSFRVSNSSYVEPPEYFVKTSEYIAELGSVYGYYRPRTGALMTVANCPIRDHKANKLIIVTRADIAERGSDVYEGFDKGVGKLAEASAYATRTIAEKVYRCKGEGGIPDGPVQVKPGEGKK